MPWKNIILRVENGRADVILNRPKQLNAMNLETFDELEECCRQVASDDRVRVVVITGAGRAFCAGADILALPQEVNVRDPLEVRRYLQKLSGIMQSWFNMEKPVIAAVNGPALGGGCNLALICDLIIAREDAVFGEVYIQRALIPDMGGTFYLPRLLGMARAKEMALLGDVIPAPSAEAIGLINRSVPADQFQGLVDEWAGRLAQGATRAIGLAKKGLNQALALDLQSAMEYEAGAIAMCFSTADFQEALTAFQEKRQPHYAGR